MTKTCAVGAVGGLLLIAGMANATPVVATFTADNHYSIYSVNGGNLVLRGGNELTDEGNPGQWNWSLPETFQFETEQVVYVAAWSDDFFGQGLLGQIQLAGSNTFFRTGDPEVKVYRTGLDRDTGSPYPPAAEVQNLVNFATANNLFRDPSVYLPNLPTTQPWGEIPGIGAQSDWIWADVGPFEDPFVPGNNWGEYLIFCFPIPTPGAASLMGVAGLMALRRRR